MPRILLLSVPVDAVTADEATARILQMLRESAQSHVMTPNNEMLVEAVHNAPFRTLLGRTALNLPDSTGLLLAARFTGQALPMRVTGVDTVERVCASLDASCPVFLLGGAPGVAEMAAGALVAKNPSLAVAGTFAGSPREEDAPAIVERINRSGARLLLVAYGAPAQDLWIDRHLPSLPSVRVAMGVGGTFDFLAGVQKRAPKAVRRLGLEWLWRLVHQPSRLPRIIRATVRFPLLVLRHGRFLHGETPKS